MVFHFPLETLLGVRRSLERQRELRFLQAVQRVVSVKTRIEDVDRSLLMIWDGQRYELQKSLSAAQLHFDVVRDAILRARRQELEKILAQREQEQEQCRREYQQAHRERETVEILRRDQLRAFHQEQSRQEQRRMDDLFLLRREYLLRR